MNCKSCGNNHQENYCPACGEKIFHPNQLSVKHFVEETFEGFIHFDTKFFRSLKTLISKPGQLSVDYVEGRRVKYMKPIQFFLVVNLLFFFLIIGNNMYSLGLDNYVTYRPFINYNTVQTVNEKLKNKKLSYAEFRESFNEKIIADSKEYIFLFVPFYGLVFFIFLFWKKTFFVEHLIFATHFMAFVLLLIFVTFYLVSLPVSLIAKIGYSENIDNILSTCIAAGIAIYTAIAVRRYYQAHIVWSLVVAGFIGSTYFIFIQYYRMLLFYKIMYIR